MQKETYLITGMTCSACSARVEKAAGKLEGVNTVSVNLLTNSMKIEYDETVLQPEAIIAAVEKAGYGAIRSGAENSAARSQNGQAGAAAQTQGSSGNAGAGLSGAGQTRTAGKELMAAQIREMKRRLIISFLLLIPLMVLSMHEMAFHMLKIHHPPAFFAHYLSGDANVITNIFGQFLLLLPILYLNRSYFSRGFKNLFHGAPNMDTLIALGSTASVVYGCFALFRIGYGLGHGLPEIVSRYREDIYFESAGTIVTLITLGKFLETRSKGKTGAAIEKLLDLSPKTAIVLRPAADNQTISEYEIPVEEVRIDDLLVIKPGARIPVDGVITEGNSALDESAITGESIPVEKHPGDTVISASVNQTGYFRMRASKVGADTTINQIIRLVEEASASKAPIAKLADQISGIFVPVVIGIALLSTIVWLLCGATFEFALSIGIAVLVISCPCALGLATPVAIMVGTGKGAENGILIKSGEALEIAHHVDTVVLDKTGTLTEGHPYVTDILPLGTDESSLLSLAFSLEKKSEHPLAGAIVTYCEEHRIAASEPTDFQAVSGEGIKGNIEGTSCYAGNEKLIPAPLLSDEITGHVKRLSDEGKTPLLFASDDCFYGIIAVADVVKPTSAEAVRFLKQMKIRTVMLTGDNERVAEAIRRQTGVDQVIAGVMPQDKEQHIRSLQEEGHLVAMIGDGINDAPALARADVGIAIGAGTEVAIESADAVLIKNDLLDAVTCIRLSKAVIRNIRQNLFWAFFYNSIGIPLAAGVLYHAFSLKLNPMFGAAAMSLSSVCVVTNALRLRFFKPLRAQTNASRADKTQASVPTIAIQSQIENSNHKEETTMQTVTVKIEGMMCEHCKKHVTEALSKLPAENVNVDLAAGNATLNASADLTDDMLRTAVTDAGYEVTEITRA